MTAFKPISAASGFGVSVGADTATVSSGLTAVCGAARWSIQFSNPVNEVPVACTAPGMATAPGAQSCRGQISVVLNEDEDVSALLNTNALKAVKLVQRKALVSNVMTDKDYWFGLARFSNYSETTDPSQGFVMASCDVVFQGVPVKTVTP